MSPITVPMPTASSSSVRNRQPSSSTHRRFSYDEIARHDHPDDCWLIINGNVYNVTSWVKKHPGGSLIYVNAGRDCTQMFESYHPLYVRGTLEKFFIGIVDPNAGMTMAGSPVLQYLNGDGATDFYTVLKQRVERHFKQNKIDPRVHPQMFIKTAVILIGFIVCYFGTFFLLQSTIVSVIFAVIMGLLVAEVGVSIQHDCNHGAYGNWNGLAYVLGASLDLVGASSFMWRQQHVVGHHVTTNIDKFDPDIRVKDPDVRRVTDKQPQQWYHRYQHIYLGLLYSLLALKSVFLDDFDAYISGYIGSVKVARMTQLEAAIFFCSKGVYFAYMIVVPAIYGIHSGWKQAALYIISQLVAGWALALMFQVAHVVGDAQFPVARQMEGRKYLSRVDMGWAAAQVATTTDFSPNSLFWTHFSGGLNYQIEHHLFPGVCHMHYPRIQPIVEATCKEFGVPYHCYPTFLSALRAHFEYLKAVGGQGFELRLHG